MDYMKKIISQSNFWYNDGLRKAKIRDMSGAIASLRRSLQYNRGNIAARNLLGLVYYGQGEIAEALVEWIISKNLQPHKNAASEYIKKVQDSSGELEVLNQAVKRYNQCLSYCGHNGEDMAIIQLKKVIEMHPSFLKAYQLLALLYLQTEQYAKARQILKIARNLDTTNEITLRYVHELITGRGKKVRRGSRTQRSRKRGKNAVEYKRGNETIIQPAQNALKFLTGKITILNIVIGVLIGASVVWFLIAPAVEETRNGKINKQIIESSERINALEAQISAQTRTLDQYRAANSDTETAVQNAASTADSYENLISAYDQYRLGDYSEELLADILLNINRNSLGDTGQARFDEMTAAVYPTACQIRYDAGMESFNVANYEYAINNLLQLVRMEESYNSGEALLNLGLSYLRSGDDQSATTYLTRCNELFPNTDFAIQAKASLDEIAQANVAEGENAAQ